MDFRGILNDMPEWGNSLQTKDKKSKKKVSGAKDTKAAEAMTVPSTSAHTSGYTSGLQFSYLSNSDDYLSSSLSMDESAPTAASEKDQGNTYFKQKKFMEAIECYSRSIALSPTSVSFANRAMAYLKLKRYEEAESDCTEALNLDDRNVKAYSRRATARKELQKYGKSVEDLEFALRLEPDNQELRKQYAEVKKLLDEKNEKKPSMPAKNSIQEMPHERKPFLEVTRDALKDQPQGLDNLKDHNKVKNNIDMDNKVKLSIEELASNAAARVKASVASPISPPKTAYEFEILWRGFSDESAAQARLLKTISPPNLPELFKNALSASLLMEIIKCITTFFIEDMDFAVNMLENLAKVPRFNMIILCLPNAERAGLCNIWNEDFLRHKIPVDHKEALLRLQPSYCRR